MPPQEPREVRWSVNSPSPGLWYADPTTGERRPWPQGPPLEWPNGDTSRPLCVDPVRCDTWIAGTSDEAPSHVCLWVGLHSLDVYRALHRWDEYEDLPPGLNPNELTADCGLPVLRPPNGPFGGDLYGFAAFRSVGDTRVYVFGVLAAESVGWGEDRHIWDSTATVFEGPVTAAAFDAARQVQVWFDRDLLGKPAVGRPRDSGTYPTDEFRTAFEDAVRANPDATQEAVADVLALDVRTLRRYLRRVFDLGFAEAKQRALGSSGEG